jgi:hypothetical protein
MEEYDDVDVDIDIENMIRTLTNPGRLGWATGYVVQN